MAQVTLIYTATRYDGTNGSALAASVYNGSVASDTGTQLLIDTQGSDVRLNVGDWLVTRPSGDTRNVLDWWGTNAEYLSRYKAV